MTCGPDHEEGKRPPVDALLDGRWWASRAELIGAVPIAAVLLVEYIDPVTNETHMLTTSDRDSVPWKHVGMLRTMINDREDELRERTE